MFKRNLFTILMALVMVFVLAGIPAVWAQTIPPRTPTPNPNQPSPQPSATSANPGASPSPNATEPSGPGPGTTPDAGSTTAPGASPATAVPTTAAPGSGPGLPAATAPSSQPGTGPGGVNPPGAGGNVPGTGQQSGTGAAGTCDETPYVKAIATVTVFAGPGTDYPVVAELGAEDMRPIIGRPFYAQWWQIQFNQETAGWVADAEVDEYGNTALVPVVDTPPINGNTPTPGAIWNPTPLPLLTCVPTPTPTSTPTSETSTADASPSGGSGTQGDAQPTPTVGMVSAEIGGSAPVTGETAVTADGPSGSGISSRSSEVSRAASPTSTMNLILPLAGLALIGGGIILALTSRKQSGAKTDTTDTTKK